MVCENLVVCGKNHPVVIDRQATMKRNKEKIGKAFIAGLMVIASAIPATAQEKLEIQITRLGVPRTIEVDRDIERLNLRESGLTSITLPEGLTNLRSLELSHNQLTSFTLPNGLTNLWSLNLLDNQLTSLTLPEGLTSLERLELVGNELTSFTLPEGLTNLESLRLHENQLTSLTLPNGLTNLSFRQSVDESHFT